MKEFTAFITKNIYGIKLKNIFRVILHFKEVDFQLPISGSKVSFPLINRKFIESESGLQ